MKKAAADNKCGLFLLVHVADVCMICEEHANMLSGRSEAVSRCYQVLFLLMPTNLIKTFEMCKQTLPEDLISFFLVMMAEVKLKNTHNKSNFNTVGFSSFLFI